MNDNNTNTMCRFISEDNLETLYDAYEYLEQTFNVYVLEEISDFIKFSKEKNIEEFYKNLLFDIKEHSSYFVTSYIQSLVAKKSEFKDKIVYCEMERIIKFYNFINELNNFQCKNIDDLKLVYNNIKVMTNERYVDQKTLDNLYKKILDERTYNVFEEYNLFQKIENLIFYSSLKLVDFVDALYFLNKSKIVKIIIGENEFKFGNEPINQMIYIDYNSLTLEDSRNKIDDIINKHNIENCELLLEYYNYNKKNIALLFSNDKNNKDNEILNELREKQDLYYREAVDELNIE